MNVPSVGEKISLGWLHIMGHMWLVEAFRMHHNITEGSDDLYGYCSTYNHTLGVAFWDYDGNPTPNSMRCNLFAHELLHAIDEYANAGLTEDQVEQLSNVLYQTLDANHLDAFPTFLGEYQSE